MTKIAETPEPPYYAVIFTSIRTDNLEGYEETAARMLKLASEQPGYLGIESAREGLGITVSYWRDLDSIRNWKHHIEHQQAQQRGKNNWYAEYSTRVAKVEKAY